MDPHSVARQKRRERERAIELADAQVLAARQPAEMADLADEEMVNLDEEQELDENHLVLPVPGVVVSDEESDIDDDDVDDEASYGEGSITSLESVEWEAESVQEDDDGLGAELPGLGQADQNPAPTYKRKLANWFVRGQIEHIHIDSYLRFMREEPGYEYLPKTARTLLGTPQNIVLTPMHPGFYYHFGLERGITKALSLVRGPFDSDHFDLFINVDGLPLTKSNGSQFWPILARIDGITGADVTPFCAGVYWGESKPFDSNDLLRLVVEELEPILNYGVEVRNVILDVRKCAFICDAPAKSFLKKNR